MLITQGKTNWKFLLIVVVSAAIVGGGILWCVTKQEIPTPEFLKAKKTEESVAAKEIILADEEIVEILKEFAVKITARFRDAEVDKILLDALEFKNTDTRDRLHNLIGKFEDLSETIEDAPDLRSWKVQRTKLCLAESIISDDLENTTQRCGHEAEPSFTGADDLLADTQIISFFINGFAHYYKEDYLRADYYFDQIKLHYSFLESFEVDFNAKHLELYNKIYNKVSEISSGVVKDEIADWQTYRNKEYKYEIKYPTDWTSLGASPGGFNIKSPLVKGKTSDRIESRIFLREGEESNQEYIDNLINQNILPGYLEVSSKKEVSINGIKGYEIIWQIKDPETNQIMEGPINVFLETPPENKARFILVIFAGEASQDNPNLRFFNKTLSTFRFIEITPTPVIDSISPQSGLVGTIIEVKGRNFSGFEGDLNAWIENANGVKGIIYGESDSNDNLIKFTLNSSYCQQDTSYSGLDCPAYLSLNPGAYKVYVYPWGIKSNEVPFTVTSP